MNSVNDFLNKKETNVLISMVTAYDYPTALMIEKSNIDAVLVGDSVAMVIHGHPHTTHATVDMMALHTKAVSRGLKSKFLITDIPFLIAHKGGDTLIDTLDLFVKSGAQAVKIEGGEEVFLSIKKTIECGVPVMGHLGLTPQSVNSLGGYKVQGKEVNAAKKMVEDALALEKIGVFAIVLECVPESLATTIQNKLKIPIIGIGAGINTDGQILVVDDLLGRFEKNTPRFCRKFENLYELSLKSLNQYHQKVTDRKFPSSEETYK